MASASSSSSSSSSSAAGSSKAAKRKRGDEGAGKKKQRTDRLEGNDGSADIEIPLATEDQLRHQHAAMVRRVKQKSRQIKELTTQLARSERKAQSLETTIAAVN